MSTSFSVSGSESFSVTEARKIAAKVSTDLKRLQRLYARPYDPTDERIDEFEQELIHLLKHDVVGSIVYGYQRNGQWTKASVRYTVSAGQLHADDDPGKILPGHDIEGATFTSFLSYNGNWSNLNETQQAEIKRTSPLQRTSASTPPLENGYWSDDLTYAPGGRGVVRSTVKG
jgi:Bacterial HORMA domain family 1